MRVIVYCLLIPYAEEVVTPHDINCRPHVVWFSDRSGLPTSLKVDLKVVNMPTDETLDYNVIAYCKKGGKNIQLYLLKFSANFEPNKVDDIRQNINKNWDHCYVAYCLYEESKGKCDLNRDKLYDVIILKYSEEPTYSDCIAGRCKLTVDLKNYCKNMDTADSALRPPINTGWTQHSPQKLPSPPKLPSPSSNGIDRDQKSSRNFNDDTPELTLHNLGTGKHESQVIITCSVVGTKFDLLYLYQSKSGNNLVLLKVVQHLKDEKGDIILSLNKKLVNSDKESLLYCTKEIPDGATSMTKTTIKKLRGGDYEYKPEDPADIARVTVEPATDTAWFSRDKSLSLVCRGTTLLDNRSLTWYIRDQNSSEPAVAEPSSQLYDRETNEQRLTLRLNEYHDSKTLFCAQDYHLVVEHANGRRSVKRYGVLAESENIKLRLQEEIEAAQTGLDSSGPDLGLVCGLVVGITVLLVVAVAVARRLCRRKMRDGGNHEENQYATAAELTYAVLDLPKPGAGAPVKGRDNASPYVQIVGVYNPQTINPKDVSLRNYFIETDSAKNTGVRETRRVFTVR